MRKKVDYLKLNKMQYFEFDGWLSTSQRARLAWRRFKMEMIGVFVVGIVIGLLIRELSLWYKFGSAYTTKLEIYERNANRIL